ncbi:MAG TPA: glycosyltransferase [Polyangiaceae bacterium]
MPHGLPRVAIFGVEGLELFSSPSAPSYETRALDCRCHRTDAELQAVLASEDPDVIVSVGELASFTRLAAAPADIARRWIHFDDAGDPARMGAAAFYCFVDNCVREREDLPPLVSVFTPTYHTGQRIRRPYASLKEQTYANWEWILVDDSDDQGDTFRTLTRLARADHRVGVFRHHAHSGTIGKVKRWACQLANGRILVELDHDDELAPRALEDLVGGFRYFDGSSAERPLAGFVYGDFAELHDDGTPFTYQGEWALGYGSYRVERWGTGELFVANSPNVNAKTIRHIVGVPNHVRAWLADCYRDIGGHRRQIHVADDYELLVRTFLDTRMARVPRLTYLQWRNRPGQIALGNTHQARNQEIQRLTRAFSQRYDAAIHERFLALGVDDFVWKGGEDSFSRMFGVAKPEVEPHCTLYVPIGGAHPGEPPSPGARYRG